MYEVAVAAGGTTFIPNFVEISELIEILGHTRTQSRTGGDLINLFCQEGQQTNKRTFVPLRFSSPCHFGNFSNTYVRRVCL